MRSKGRKFKADGFTVYVHILCDVYGNGYYFKPDDYEGYILDLAEDCGITGEKVQLIIAFMADRTLLDALSLNKNTVFTSHGIQKRYAEAMKGRKRSIAEIKGEYWLLSEEEEREINTFYKTQPFQNKSEKNADKSEKNADKSEIYSITEQNKTESIDVYPKDNLSCLTRTREEWVDIIGGRCNLDSAQASCIACFGDDEAYNTVLNTLLDVLVGKEDVKVGDKVYSFSDIVAAVERAERNTVVDIIGAFCKVNPITNKIEKKQVSNPTSYIITILMAK